MNERLARLRAAMGRDGLDAVLLTSSPSIRYFCGFSGDDATLIATGSRAAILTDARYTTQARTQTACEVIQTTRADCLEKVKAVLQTEACARIGFEDDHMTVAARAAFDSLGLDFVPYGKECRALRLIKSPDEIVKLKQAQGIADRAFAELCSVIRPGMSEKRVAAELLYLCAKLGSNGPAFPPIVGSGENGAMCHLSPGERELRRGDLVVLDFGCRVDGYCSDMTRTVAIGQPGERERQVYGIVRRAQQKALDALRPGLTGRELDTIARDDIIAQGYGEAFGHGLGHGFGLEVHEGPAASQSAAEILLAGMTLTVEPGIYLPEQFGVRIEDCCLLTETGHENFSATTKELITI